GRQFRQQIFKPCIADERNVMPLVPAPYTDYLWHDAGKIGIHHASIQSARRAPRNDINDPDVEFSHGRTTQPFPGCSHMSLCYSACVSPFTLRYSVSASRNWRQNRVSPPRRRGVYASTLTVRRPW